MTDSGRLVQEFCAAWGRLSGDELAEYFADDAVYHNMPLDPIKGKEAIRTALAGITKNMGDLTFEVVNQVVEGGVVMNERVDRYTSKGKKVALPVMGAFEVQDGKIKAWRDYFDTGMAGGP